ncbi:Orf34 [Pseudomonas syringae pv. cilantro]|uniref:Orf34 n=2 Tax=Pseudomonas syringae group TaxID=136849 RepID=A0A0N0GCN5_PSESX|nr:YopJ family acetyltransferase [Pseudomonas syringae group genomosp. 3]KPC24194.1 Orf34 [Pseudomonas syringae pv. cilantro]KPW78349.1 Orf34 [Pseudomonas syringae pv. coriandricola]RMN07456.1 Orf34 [Pseudomonas syringae pv. coriandricola]
MGNICVGGFRMPEQADPTRHTDAPRPNEHIISNHSQGTTEDTESRSPSVRLQKKINDLKPYVARASGSLKDYGQAAIDRASGKKIGLSFAKLDAEHLDAMVEVENQRNPGLNLRHFNDQQAFIKALEEQNTTSFRAIFPQTSPDTMMTVAHHVMADVRLHQDGPPSIVITEPAVVVDSGLNQLYQHNHFLNELRDSGVPLSQVAIIETQAQKTKDDCVMYSLNYAIKAHKNAQQFNDLHEELHRGTLSIEPESRAHTTVGAFEQKKRYAALYEGTHAAFGADVLPADFYKHGASLTQAEELMERTDGRMAGRVNSERHSNAENLVERNKAFRVPRRELLDAQKQKDNEFSASIDGFRLQEIQRVMTAEQRGELPIFTATLQQQAKEKSLKEYGDYLSRFGEQFM